MAAPTDPQPLIRDSLCVTPDTTRPITRMITPPSRRVALSIAGPLRCQHRRRETRFLLHCATSLSHHCQDTSNTGSVSSPAGWYRYWRVTCKQEERWAFSLAPVILPMCSQLWINVFLPSMPPTPWGYRVLPSLGGGSAYLVQY